MWVSVPTHHLMTALLTIKTDRVIVQSGQGMHKSHDADALVGLMPHGISTESVLVLGKKWIPPETKGE